MGNCLSSRHGVPVDDRSVDTTRKRQLPKKKDDGKDATEATYFEPEVENKTLPLSPEPTSSSRRSEFENDYYDSPLQKRAAVVKYEIVEHSPQRSGRELVSAGPRRQGRALQARLEKARYMQMALSKSSSLPSADSGVSPGLTSRSSTIGDDSTSEAQQGGAIVPYKYSLSAETSRSSEKLNDEFEASISQGMIWAEFDRFDKVLALALSRSKPSLNMSTPPLFLAVGTDDGTVSVTELLDDTPIAATGSESASYPASSYDGRLGPALTIRREGRIRSLDFSPDGRYLAVGGDDGTCVVFRLVYEQIDDMESLTDLEMCAEVQRVDRVYAVQFSPNSSYLAVGGFDGTVAIVSMEGVLTKLTPEVLVEIPRDGLVFSVDWSPDGRYLAIGGSDKTCAVIDVEASWQVFREFRRSAAVQTVRWHPHVGRYLAIGSADIAIISRESLTVVHELSLSHPEESAANNMTGRSIYRVNAICWSPNGSYLVSCGSDNRCTVLETKTFAPVHEVRRADKITSVVWGQQSVIAGTPRRYLAVGGEDRKVVILKAGLETNQGDSSVGDDMSSSAASSYFSKRGEWVFKENAFRDLEDAVPSSSADEVTNGSAKNVLCIAFSRGSKSRPSSYIAYATEGGLVTIRSSIEWKIVAELHFERSIRSIAFANGSRFLSLASEDSRVYVVVTSPSWSVILKKEFSSPALSLAFSKNNERLAVGTADGRLTMFDPRTSYGAAGEINSSGSPILALDWSSKNLAVGRKDGTVSIFASEQIYSSFYVPVVDIKRKDPVLALAFGISSRFLAVGGNEGCVGVYSAKGGWVLCHQVRAESGVLSVRWSPTGRFLAFSGQDRLFRVIDTIFWAEVDEVQRLSTSPNDEDGVGCGPIPGLSFSQDGKLLAFGGEGLGATIVDTSSWEVTFTPQFSVNGKENDIVEASSLSSRDEEIDAIALSE